MLSLWANWLVTKFGLNSLKRYLWPVLYFNLYKSTRDTCIDQKNVRVNGQLAMGILS